MSQMKQVARTMQLLELYAQRGEPLTLTDLARGLQAPVSTTLGLVRTLASDGYLYQPRKRAYYPTKKLMGLCKLIDARDPVLDVLHPYLARLRETSGETAVLGKRENLQVLYLDSEHSLQPIRYTAQAGETRQLHSNSLGKALLSVMDHDELRKLLDQIQLDTLTDKTLATQKALLDDLALSRERGWAANVGESVPDLAAIAAPFSLAGQWYALSIVGPLERMQARWVSHAQALKEIVQQLSEALEVHENDIDG